MPWNQIAYFELPASDLAHLQRFYAQLFGWSFQDFGDDYAAVHGSGLEAGFNADEASKTRSPLAMIETDAIEDMQQRIEAAGGTITRTLFAYPGGRRFHFTDPSGNELALLQPDAEQS